MWLIESNINGQFYYEILEDAETVNGDRFLAFLKAMFEYMTSRLGVTRCKLYLMHVNARPHISQIVKNWIVENKITLATQLRYYLMLNFRIILFFEISKHLDEENFFIIKMQCRIL